MSESVDELPLSWVRRVSAVPRRVYDWMLAWSERPGAIWALAGFAFVEASFFPVPPDVLLIGMCLALPRRSLMYAAVCTVASVLGGLFGYAIGAFFWQALDQTFYAYVPGFTPARFAVVQGYYHQYGIPIVFTAGFSPIPYKLFTITSGVMDLPLLPFLLASAAGRAGRFFLVAGLIYRFGPPIRDFIDRFFGPLVLAFTVLLAGGFLVLRWVA